MMRGRLELLVRARSRHMLRSRHRLLPTLPWVLPLALGAAGLAGSSCGQLPADGSSTQAAIVGGTADTADTAVMALVHQTSSTMSEACSGTTIATVGESGIFLTAAHCVVANAASPMGGFTPPIEVADPSSVFILPGPDWMANFNAGQYFGVGQVAIHPCYNGDVNSPYDVALVRYLGALPTTPIIPAMTAAEDKLAVGTSLTVIGFGKTLTNSMNSERFEVTRSIETISSNQFLYTQTDDKGACEGDSGGPDLVQTADGVRVAGVTSFGDPTCTMVGASVRVSPVADFIDAFIAAAPKTLSCDECSLASVGPGNACITQGVQCGDPSTPCGKFIACANGCRDQTCVTQCGNTNAQGLTQYNAVVTCQCGGMCQAPCANNQACGGSQPDTATAQTFSFTCGGGVAGATGTSGAAGSSGAAGAGAAGPSGAAGSGTTTGAAGSSTAAGGCGLTDPRAACESCIQSTCCTEAAACGSDATCASCLANPSASCTDSFAFRQLNTCLSGCSGTPCSGASPTPAAGAGGAGGAPENGGKSGCGCDLTPAPGRASGLGLLLALALVGARSRRRR